MAELAMGRPRSNVACTRINHHCAAAVLAISVPPSTIVPRVGWPPCLAAAAGGFPVMHHHLSPPRAEPSRLEPSDRCTPLLCSVASER
uniref:Uncharacterized protein n=1 Tax=Oryza glumipatula TaxID=40148 RepID=A0A0E0AZP8_9ORYZ